MTRDEIAALRRDHDGNEWRLFRDDYDAEDGDPRGYITHRIDDGNGTQIARIEEGTYPDGELLRARRDAASIVATHNAAPALLDAAEECERLRAECAEYEVETMAWQDASGLTGDECRGGDPSDITPEKLAAWDWPGKFDAAAARAEAAEKRADEREAARAELDAMLCKKFAEESDAKKRIEALEEALGEALTDFRDSDPPGDLARLRAVLRNGSGATRATMRETVRVEVLRCERHHFVAVAIDDVRVTPKCCGSWTVIKAWTVPSETIAAAIRARGGR